jgi:small subunit ribosomal protein S20
MAKVHKSVVKRARQNEVRRERNNAVRSSLRTSIRKLLRAIDSGDVEVSKTELSEATRALGKAASKGVIHRNQASRKISRLTRRVNALSTSA